MAGELISHAPKTLDLEHLVKMLTGSDFSRKTLKILGISIALGALGLTPVLASNDFWVAPGTAHKGLNGGFSEIACWSGEKPAGVPDSGKHLMVDTQIGVISMARVDVPAEVMAKYGYSEPDVCADTQHKEGVASGAVLLVFSDGMNGVVVDKAESSLPSLLQNSSLTH